MARKRPKPLPPEVLQDDIDTYLALKAIEDQLPPEIRARLDAATVGYEAMLAAQEAERKAERAAHEATAQVEALRQELDDMLEETFPEPPRPACGGSDDFPSPEGEFDPQSRFQWSKPRTRH